MKSILILIMLLIGLTSKSQTFDSNKQSSILKNRGKSMIIAGTIITAGTLLFIYTDPNSNQVFNYPVLGIGLTLNIIGIHDLVMAKKWRKHKFKSY